MARTKYPKSFTEKDKRAIREAERAMRGLTEKQKQRLLIAELRRRGISAKVY